MKFLLLSLILVASLFAQKVLYLNYKDVPQRVVKGEIFSITLKTLSVVKEYDKVHYSFANQKGLKLLNEDPQRDFDGKYLYDKFYFLTTASKARTPDITAYIENNNSLENIDVSEDSPVFQFNIFQKQTEQAPQYEKTTIAGKRLNVITLNPIHNFSNIVAKSFEIIDYRTTSFDQKHNIIVFIAKANNANLKVMHFENVYKQGIESITDSYLDSKITYFLIVDKKIENFSFSYFNLLKNKFESINIPIVVDDDSVVTQSDLKPKDQSRNKLKATIALTIAIAITVFALYRRKIIYIILFVVPLSYFIWLNIPSEEICIKKGTKIHLLPVKNGTIFETTNNRYFLLKEGKVRDFTKVRLYNDMIGWVKDEDICKN